MRLLEIYITLGFGAILLYLVVTNYQGTEVLLNSISKLNYNAIGAFQGKGQTNFVQ